MAALLADRDRRVELRARGVARAAAFCWEATARRTLACYRELAAARPQSVSERRRRW